MKAIILAAGKGRRFAELTDGPKCLLKIGSKSLIERYFDAFNDYQINEVVIVVGHKKELLIDHVNSLNFSGKVKFIDNPDYAKGSILSLWRARHELNVDVILMDSDVYFEKEILGKIVSSSKNNLLIIDTKSTYTGEEVMAGINNGRVINLARSLPGSFDVQGEWIGFLKLNQASGIELQKILSKSIESGKEKIGYEDLIPKLFDKVSFGYEMVEDLKWTEIDFPEDVRKAQTLNSEIYQ